LQVKLIRGFTLIELLIVVAIIGTLAAIGTVAYNGYIGGAKKSAATNAMLLLHFFEGLYFFFVIF
jgi:prepilin-type N-terminal cleavage/methylation domain-containing protein